MTDDPKTFSYSLASIKSSCPFYDKPILKSISHIDFIRSFKKLANKDKRTIAFTIKRRYESPFNSKLLEEIEWLRDLDEVMKVECENWKGKIASIHFNEMIEVIEIAIKNLQEVVTQAEEKAKEQAASPPT